MILIKQSLVDTVIGVAKNVYPEEFVGLLRENKRGEIDTLLVIPNSTYGRGFSGIRWDMLPLNLGYCGSVHSHPNHNNRPSSTDLRFFARMGSTHIIISYPFTLKTMKVYDVDGREQGFEIVE